MKQLVPSRYKYMLWFNSIPGLKIIFLCFKLIIYHTLPYPKTKEIKFKPRVKLNHKIPTKENVMKLVFEGAVVSRLP